MFVEARLEGYGLLWQSGREVINCQVHLGQGDKSCNCSVTLADPTGTIAADLVEHSLRSGGIAPLPDSRPQASPGTAASPNPVMGAGSTFDGALSPERKAFLDMVAWAEGADYNVAFTGANFALNGQHPRQLYCSGDLCSDASGRYQFLSTTWDSLGLPDFSPASQDRGALMLMEDRGRMAAVDSGNVAAMLEAASYEWASLPPYRYAGQGTKTLADCQAYYSDRLAFYRASSGTASLPPESASQPTLAAAQISTTANFKGAKLLVTINDTQFTFYHQGTETNDQGITTLTGQGIQWVLNRRPRNRTATDISLKQLAEEVCKAHGMQLEWLSDFEPKYTFLDQTGLSDYQLLLRECERCGLFISEAAQKLTVKSLRQIRDTQLVLSPGNNLITYQIKDQALDKTQTVPDRGSSLAQAEAKVDIDITTGQMTQVNPEVDPANSPQSLTGAPATAPSGTLAPGQDGIASNSRARVKRVKGLPSVFTVPLSQHTLALEPLDAVRTVGLPGSLSRIWMVDSVAHDVASATTKINAFSPVEVLDLSPANPVVASGSAPATNPGGFIYPVKGFPVTDVRRWRSESRFHHGTDVGCPEGTPIYASASGTVVDRYHEEGGYGNVIYLKHPDGFETRYAHLSQFLVNVGDTVQQGQQIALSGNTGVGTGSHLHFELRDPSGNSHSPEDVGLSATVGQVW